MLEGLRNAISKSRPPSPSTAGTSVPSEPSKKRRHNEGGFSVETSLEDLFHFCIRLSKELDEQKQYTTGLEERIRELSEKVDTLEPLPPPSSLTPRTPEPAVTRDVEMSETAPPTAPSSTILPAGTVETVVLPPPQPETPSDLERSVVIARLPIDPTLDAEAQVWRDYNQVVSLTSLTGYPCLPISVYRMPVGEVDSSHIRLTKVVLPTRQHAKLFVKNANRVARDPHFKEVYIRPSYADREDPRRKIPGPRTGRNGPSLPPPTTTTVPSTRPTSHHNDRSNGQNARQRQRRDSVFSTMTTRRPPPSVPPPSRLPRQSPPPLLPTMSNGYGQPSPMPFFPPPMHPFPLPYSFPNPFVSHFSQYGMPPNYGTQGNW